MSQNEITSIFKECGHIGGFNISKGFAMAKFTSGNDLRRFKTSLTDVNLIIHVMVIEGDLTVRIKVTKYLVTKSCFGDFRVDGLFEVVDASTDAVVYILIWEELYFRALVKNKPPFPVSYILRLKQSPIFVVDDNIMLRLIHRIRGIEDIFHFDSHLFKNEMLEMTEVMYFMEIANFYILYEQNSEKQAQTDRQRLLFVRFIRLLHSNITRHRNVHFYAESLCVTPQYLNRIVRHCSNRCICDWISSVLIGELTLMLETTDNTISHIAEHFNFSDYTSLAKYFKRHTGLSPSEHRKKYSYSPKKG